MNYHSGYKSGCEMIPKFLYTLYGLLISFTTITNEGKTRADRCYCDSFPFPVHVAVPVLVTCLYAFLYSRVNSGVRETDRSTNSQTIARSVGSSLDTSIDRLAGVEINSEPALCEPSLATTVLSLTITNPSY